MYFISLCFATDCISKIPNTQKYVKPTCIFCKCVGIYSKVCFYKGLALITLFCHLTCKFGMYGQKCLETVNKETCILTFKFYPISDKHPTIKKQREPINIVAKHKAHQSNKF